ncbi:MAG: family 43 glycosylhydrolase [Bacteroides sp.]|nr:family 43 glycosylhydrolase [Bacteroides sp.]
MKTRHLIQTVCLAGLFGFSVSANAQNTETWQYPMKQTYAHNPLFVNFPSPMHGMPDKVGTMYTADPTARVWNINGREVLYVYCSHDMEPQRGCDYMDRYHVYSTEDMKTWTDHGEILTAEYVNNKLGYEGPGFMWAPDCVYNPHDQLYYYFFPHKVKLDGSNKWQIFVATSKDPAGGFEPICRIEGTPSAFDPCVMVDDDGQPYLYIGGSKRMFAGKLKKDDWTKLDGEMQEVKNLPDFHEGPWVFKVGDTYYLSYPDNHSPRIGGNQMRYATSKNPLGPWEYKGVYMYPQGEETAHGSVVNFKGQWYQFYHTGNYSGNPWLRSVCVDKLSFDENGGINLVHNWGTPKGRMPQVSKAGITRIEAERFNKGGSHCAWFKRPGNGEIQVKKEKGVKYVSGMIAKEWIRYSMNVAEPGDYVITCRVRQNEHADSKMTIGIDGEWKNVNVSLTGPKGEWQEVRTKAVKIDSAGEHYIEWRSTGGDIDMDWITVEAAK